MNYVWYVTCLIFAMVFLTSPQLVGEWSAKYRISYESEMTMHYCTQQAQMWECENHE